MLVAKEWQPEGVSQGHMQVVKKAIKFWLDAFFALRALIALKRLKQPTLVILTYHRILPEDDPHRHFEQPGMITSPNHLRNNIQTLQSLGAKAVFLDDWLDQREHSPETLPQLAFAVTFDDGWRDNYAHGLSILRETGTPSTIFLVSDLLDTEDVFWPEHVLYILTTVSPETLKQCPDGSLDWLQPYLGNLPLGNRKISIEEADKVINRLKTLNDREINQHLSKLFKQCPELQPHESSPFILTSSDIQELAQSGLVRFGAHTRHHYRLNRLENTAQLEDEVVICKHVLEDQLSTSIKLFCYPNGDITSEGEALVETHYVAACTTSSGLNSIQTSAYKLRRLNLHDGNAPHRLGLLATLGRGAL
ncbi:polysaccharide deacetylase family protein [Marinobacteraceae bacterium S3BR75-40.1]